MTLNPRLFLLLCLVLCCGAGVGYGQTGLDPDKALHHYRHEAWQTKDGLPDGPVTSIVQDETGYLWLSTHQGVVRFDGVRFTQASDAFAKLARDAEHTIWLHTYANGMTRYRDGRFTRFTTENGLPTNQLYSLYPDPNGSLWIGTYGSGLIHWRDSTLAVYTQADGLPGNIIQSLDQAPDGSLWIGTTTGLSHFHNGTFTNYTRANGLPSESIAALVADRNGGIWIGTDAGLAHLQHGRVRTYTTENGLTNNTIRALFQDQAGTLWIGTNNGITRYSAGRFSTFTTADGLQGKAALSFWEDAEGSLWIGTSSGLNRLLDTPITTFTEADGLPYHFAFAVLEDHAGAVWMGTGRGLTRLQNGQTRTFTLADGLAHDGVTSLLEDRSGTLWVGTAQEGVTLIENQTVTGAYSTQDGLVHNRIDALFQDRQGRIWIGTQNGLSIFENGTFTNYTAENGLSHQIVVYFAQDAEGTLWIATYGGGLNRFKDGEFTAYTTQDGLLHDVVFTVLPEEDGTLWIGTRQGLNRVRAGQWTGYTTQHGLWDAPVANLIDDGQGYFWIGCNKGIYRVAKADFDRIDEGTLDRLPIQTFGRAEGLLTDAVSGGWQPSAWQAQDGALWYATPKGVARLHPRKAVAPPVTPRVLIEQAVVDTTTYPTPTHLDLDAGRTRFAFQYTALSLRNPTATRFAYHLDGYDDAWIETGRQRTAYYTGLPPGTYTFRVRAATQGGQWTEAEPLTLYLRPRFYQTWWFPLLCLLSGLLLIGLVYGTRVTRLKTRQAELERIVSERTQTLQAQAEKLTEMDRLKSQFFANLSHEFRTPLTLTLGPVENLLHTPKVPLPAEAVADLRMAHRNGRRLLSLINQLLDLSKLEAGHMNLSVQPTSLNRFLRVIVGAFSSMAERKHITLRVEETAAAYRLYVDTEKLEKVFYNLISNALKFTPEHGKVWVGIEPHTAEDWPEGSVKIQVRDTGQGIPKAHLQHIFDRFYQVDGSATRAQAGTGIGLALTRELIHLHHGHIQVDSAEGFGTTFTVFLRGGQAHFNPEDFAAAPAPLPDHATAAEPETVPHATPPNTASTLPEDTETVLVIDDNADVRAYIQRCLQATYHVLTAEDGAAGLALAQTALPDLIISDVMMPEMDGYALTTALKADPRLDFIPVILLTARAAEQYQMAGLEAGADDYLVKPFNAQVLLARVKNLIQSRHRLRERFGQEVKVQASPVEVPSADDAFLQRAQAEVEARLSDPHLSVSTLADALGLSARQLQRRLRTLTDQSPSAFIRSLRVQRAQQLLAQHAGTVSEVAYAVGFNSVSYFAKCFREAYGIAPSEVD